MGAWGVTAKIVLVGGGRSIQAQEKILPAIIVDAGDRATERFLEFFAATIRNKNTRTTYAHAIGQFFNWCEANQIGLETMRPLPVTTLRSMK
jgi:hypothetical protein